MRRTLALALLTFSVAFPPAARAGQTPTNHHSYHANHHNKPAKVKPPKAPKVPKAQKTPKHAKAPNPPKPPKNQYTTTPGSTKIHTSHPQHGSQTQTAPRDSSPSD